MFILLGAAIGAFGTLIGVGGGVLLIPILLFIYPDFSPVTITAISLVVVFFNASSGSVAYARMKRTDFISGLQFSITAVPGAILGAIIAGYISRGVFQIVFGTVLILVAGYLFWKPSRRINVGDKLSGSYTRTIVDRQGIKCTYSYNRPLGMALAFFVGIVSGLLGIGGGVIHVPILTQLMSFPVHIATATSHLVVAVSTLAAIITHIVNGTLFQGLSQAIFISIGAIGGAQLGARLSHRVSPEWIVRLLAIALAIVALRLFLQPR